MTFICHECSVKKFFDVSTLSKSLIAMNLRRGLVHGPNGEHALDMVEEANSD